MRFTSRIVICAALALGALALAAGPASAASHAGTVYTSTNSSAGNAVLAFDRAGDGSLRPAGSFATGGDGTGAGLGSQSALALTRQGHLLYTVNAGSDSISAFSVRPNGDLDLLNTTPSNGDEPISLTVHRDLLYVLNAGSGGIAGFTGARDGDLQALAGSQQALAGSNPAQVGFTPGGDAVVVTEKDSNTIDTFPINTGGQAGPAQSNPSEGQTPFGFAFDPRGHLLVSEAFGGAVGASALSSYSVTPTASLDTISASVSDGQTSACWVQVSNDGRFAYTTNTGSGTISSYTVRHDGSLELLRGIAADTGAGSTPTDLAESRGGRVLVALLPGTQSEASYRVGGHGELQPVDQVGGVPAAATGLAAR
jgi:6-phosphogluconolactonase (cycloisomerase 2 family)